MPFERIDMLEIDTEGNDPMVIKGAKEILQKGLVRLLFFEYHGIGKWKDISLKSVMQDLLEMHYICYFAARKGRLYPIWGHFWSDVYEFKQWSNVVCFLKDDPWHALVTEHIIY